MASGKGKTFRLGKMMVNLSERGLATKDTETGEIKRYMFPWAQPKPQNPDPQSDDMQYDDQYDEDQPYDEGYDSQDYDEPEYDADNGEYYAPEEDDYDEQPAGILDAPWLMWVALVVFPPLGIWLLWRNNRFEIISRSAISAASIIWFVVLLIWLFSSLNRSPDHTDGPPITTPSPSPTVTVSPTPSATPTSTAIPQTTPTPSATPNTGETPNAGDATGTTPSATDAVEFVWSKQGGEHYHLDQNCSGMSGATRVYLSVALNRKQTACPDCFPTEADTKPTATPLPSGSYYSTPTGTWYHSDPNCKGMSNAQVVSQSEAMARNQTPCPDCIGSVYMTDGGQNYHSNSTCRGMQNAYLTTIDKAIAAGKTACATCMDGASTGTTGTTTTGSTGSGNTYWYNPGGQYYHKTSNCSGMTGAIQGTASAAENNGKTACPVCLDGTSANASFWATTNGKWYHAKSNCQGMTNATRITEATAISRGKTACPVCAGGVASGGETVHVNPGNTGSGNNTTVSNTVSRFYSTETGKYFHSKSSCSGMNGATEVTASQIAERKQSACPDCIGTSGTYYSTPTGKYYHSKSNCSGMKNASIVTLAMINARKQNPCPDCIGGGVTGATYYWATGKGKHYHSKSNCSGMKNATKVTADEAEDRGQTACPTCVGSVWGTDDGKYYHKNSTCTGMKGAYRMTIQAAEKDGKDACPKCITNATPTPKPTATPKPGEDDNDSSLYYYATSSGRYYHRESDCSGMKGASKVSESTATARGQKPCPECIGSVWATASGDHYHSKSNCSGMNGASLVTVDTAELRGQSPCPECLGEGDNDAPQTGSTDSSNGGTVAADPDSTYVYCTLAGKYYHSERHCSGMQNAASVTLSWALDHNYQQCDDCDAPAAS